MVITITITQNKKANRTRNAALDCKSVIDLQCTI